MSHIHAYKEDNDGKPLEDRMNDNSSQHKFVTFIAQLQAKVFFLTDKNGADFWLVKVKYYLYYFFELYIYYSKDCDNLDI